MKKKLKESMSAISRISTDGLTNDLDGIEGQEFNEPNVDQEIEDTEVDVDEVDYVDDQEMEQNDFEYIQNDHIEDNMIDVSGYYTGDEDFSYEDEVPYEGHISSSNLMPMQNEFERSINQVGQTNQFIQPGEVTTSNPIIDTLNSIIAGGPNFQTKNERKEFLRALTMAVLIKEGGSLSKKKADILKTKFKMSDREQQDAFNYAKEAVGRLNKAAIVTGKLDEDNEPNDDNEPQVYAVHIRANVYDGRNYDARTTPILIYANNEQHAIDIVNNNKEKILDRISKRRIRSGKRLIRTVPKDVKNNVFFSDSYYMRKQDKSIYDSLENMIGYDEVMNQKNDLNENYSEDSDWDQYGFDNDQDDYEGGPTGKCPACDTMLRGAEAEFGYCDHCGWQDGDSLEDEEDDDLQEVMPRNLKHEGVALAGYVDVEDTPKVKRKSADNVVLQQEEPVVYPIDNNMTNTELVCDSCGGKLEQFSGYGVIVDGWWCSDCQDCVYDDHGHCIEDL